jgi:hypothetical protein
MMKKSERKGDPTVIELLTASCAEVKKTLAEVLATEGLGMREQAAAILSGEHMFPIEWLKPVAAALDIDPAFFFHIYMQNYFLEGYEMMAEFLDDGGPYTANEKKLIVNLRQLTGTLENRAVVVDSKRVVGVVLI